MSVKTKDVNEIAKLVEILNELSESEKEKLYYIAKGMQIADNIRNTGRKEN